MESYKEIVTTLMKENSRESFLTASQVLIKFADNILKSPNEDKYRKIRIGNPMVQDKLLTSVGGMECLFIMGFEESEDGEHLILPKESSLESLKRVKDELVKESTNMERQQGSQLGQASVQQRQRAGNAQTESEAMFFTRIRDGMKRVLLYEKLHVQQKAQSIIPVDSLQSEADTNFKSAQAKGESKLDIRDFLLLALLKWFKFSFFKWVDTLPCNQCGGATKHNGSVPPSSDDLRWGAGRVEAHLCNTCGTTSRFPRYTNAEKLLDSRRGRCGEWADCFTLCCRALGFEARFVMDWTDHVWTEVFSHSRSRWLHCDPCENVCDKPLLYESGWGKKLSYVIAVSKDEVQDVSWRYSNKHDELLVRRRLCRESWLRRTVHQMWRQQITVLSAERQNELWARLVRELSEFISIKVEDEQLPGRTTGSFAWRQARGELGTESGAQCLINTNCSANTGFVFTATASERESEAIHVVYSSATDTYIRVSANNEKFIGWEKCAFSAEGIFRKEEPDWKMTYLARMEGRENGQISWKFDLKGTDLKIGKVELKAQTASFENGKVTWTICSDGFCTRVKGEDVQQTKTIDVNGGKTLEVTASLDGGKGANAWQHAQLFRLSLEDKNSYSFDIKLKLI